MSESRMASPLSNAARLSDEHFALFARSVIESRCLMRDSCMLCLISRLQGPIREEGGCEAVTACEREMLSL